MDRDFLLNDSGGSEFSIDEEKSVHDKIIETVPMQNIIIRSPNKEKHTIAKNRSNFNSSYNSMSFTRNGKFRI
jgi:hypothetical protein